MSAIFGTVSQATGPMALLCGPASPGSQSVTVTGRLSPGTYIVGGDVFVQSIADMFSNGSYTGSARFGISLQFTP